MTTHYKLLTSTKAEPVTILSDEGWTIFQSESKDGDNVAKFYKNVGTLYRCVRLRSDAIRRLPWRILNDRKKELWVSTEQKPPPVLTWCKNIRQLNGMTEAALILKAEAFWHIERNRAGPMALRWFSPLSMTPIWSKDDGLTHFDRRLSSSLRPIPMPVEDIVYTWLQDPLHETKPDQPPAGAAMMAAGVLYNTNLFTSGFLERGAIKATLLTVQGSIAEQERNRLKSWWKRLVAGVKNAGNAEVVSADVKPVIVGEGLQEMSNTELTGENREEIATALGVPHSMVFSNAANYATSRVDKLNFHDETIIPESELIADFANEQLFHPLGLQFEFLPERLDIYQEDEHQRAQSFVSYVGAGMKPSVAAELLGIDLPHGIEYKDLDGAMTPTEAPDTTDQTAAKAPILGYHIESGVVTRNEARANIGLPPVDESSDQKLRDLRGLLEIVTIATSAGIPMEQAAKLVGLELPAMPEAEPVPPVPQPTQPTQPDAEQFAEKRAVYLDKWRRMVRNRHDKGKSLLHEFDADGWLSPLEIAYIRSRLVKATTKEAIDAAFLPQEEGGTDQGFFTIPQCWAGKAIPDAAQSVAAWKQLILRLDDEDEEKEQKVRMGLERQTERDLAKALAKEEKLVLSRIRRYDEAVDWFREDLEATLQAVRDEQDLYDMLQRALLQGVDLGVSTAVTQFDRIGLGFDYTLAHQSARAWASDYAFTLVSGIDDTTTNMLRQSLTTWVDNGLPLQDLTEQLIPVFGEKRAELISSTEVTRAYAQGTLAGYTAAGFTGEPTETIPAHPRCRCWWSIRINDDGSAEYIWMAAEDEKMCPICGGNSGQVFGLAREAPKVAA